jgi:RNA polymerase sigma-70 factor (ECF subfamily)
MAARRQRFELLYADWHAAVYGYVLRRTDNPDDAADAIAETFLTAWRRLDDVPTSDHTRLWLYAVARRVLANQRRGMRRRSALADRLRSEIGLSHHPPEQSSELQPLASAFQRLSKADRELLALEGWEGLKPSQVASVLGCSPNAARIRLHRAHRRLAAQLADPPTPRAAAYVRPGETT